MARDWADEATDKVIADINGRSGMDWDLDEETDAEIRETLAKIIREAAPGRAD